LQDVVVDAACTSFHYYQAAFPRNEHALNAARRPAADLRSHAACNKVTAACPQQPLVRPKLIGLNREAHRRAIARAILVESPSDGAGPSVQLIAAGNDSVGRFKIGRYAGFEHLVQDKKVREVREALAAHILMNAYRHLETAVLDAALLRKKTSRT